jgi:two-component system response regulator NreC
VQLSPTLTKLEAIGTPAVLPGRHHTVPSMLKEPPAIAAARISVLLVDDHAILREGLRALLELEPDIDVLGEAGTFEEALKRAVELMPDIVLTDIGLPGRSGLSLVTELRKHCPHARVVLLTAHSSEEYLRAGLDVRADGYVLKDSGREELVAALRSVVGGQQYLCKAVADTVMATYLSRDGRPVARSPLQTLTERERQVLTRVASGHSNKAVARDLILSVKTVEKHRANLMRKLSLHNAADITRFALNHHLVAHNDREVLGVRDLRDLVRDLP